MSTAAWHLGSTFNSQNKEATKCETSLLAAATAQAEQAPGHVLQLPVNTSGERDVEEEGKSRHMGRKQVSGVARVSS